jgi:hypothetical protein
MLREPQGLSGIRLRSSLRNAHLSRTHLRERTVWISRLLPEPLNARNCGRAELGVWP